MTCRVGCRHGRGRFVGVDVEERRFSAASEFRSERASAPVNGFATIRDDDQG